MNFVGTSGWSYDHWVDKFYPEGLERNKWLEFYSENFNTVEINMSFYRFPFKNMVKGWVNKTPEGFLFFLKANRQITHVRKLKNISQLVKKFDKLAVLLGEKLGGVLYQLPPSLHFDLEKLEKFLSILPERRNVIEFRHTSWFCNETIKLLNKYKIIFCVVSAPKLPEMVKKSTNEIYVRFHGREWYRYDYTKKELKNWAQQIKRLKPKNTFIYFNNDFNAYAVKNAKTMKCLI